SDYGAFRDLQRHRMLTVQWQALTPELGADVPEQGGLAGGGARYERRLEGPAKAVPRRPSPSSASGSLVALALAQLDPPDLAGQRLGQIRDELHQARVGVGGQVVADVGLDLLRQSVARLVPGGEHDERLDHLATPFVRRGD